MDVTSQQHTFKAPIQVGDGGGAFVTVPLDVEQTLGKKRVRVKATIDGEPYQGSLVRMGGACHMLIILKEIRQKIGKGAGDEVQVTVQEDVEPRVVNIPPDFKQALEAAPEADPFFRRLSYTHQREYVQWIEEAKREQTRRDRIARAIRMLAEGKKAR